MSLLRVAQLSRSSWASTTRKSVLTSLSSVVLQKRRYWWKKSSKDDEKTKEQEEEADSASLPKDVEKPYDVMFVGHFDTVFEPGTAAERPFSIEGDRAMGPGVADMKGGLLLAFYLTMELKERYPDMNILIVNNGDEEGGSPASGRSLTDISKKARYAFVMEPGRINGGFVRSRKGVEEIRIRFRGKAAHAGIEPEKGVNAITEAAMWIPKLHKLNDPEKGIIGAAMAVFNGSDN